MVAVIDYGVGNLFSLSSSLNYLDIANTVTADKKVIEDADSIILPGVGAFKDAYRKLEERDMVDFLEKQVKKGKPLLGICLGMQMLFEKSYEYGEHKGLGFIKGEVSPVSDDIDKSLKVPHMGWNSLIFKQPSPLFKYIKEGDYVYFVHSYYAKNCSDYVTASSFYGTDITAAVQNGNVFGTQFHPEKSGKTGLDILKAFSEVK